MVERENKRDNKKEAGSVEIEYYTDPLCCWSWALEPQWRRLRFEYSGRVKWRYRMGGLIPNWESFNDPMNVVNRPLQMGPLWMEAKYVSGMPIRDKIWYENPPASSFPACIAVKAAGLQSPVASEAYLRKVREAVMLQGQNVGERDVLRQVGRSLAEVQPDVLDADVFERDLGGEEARKAFEEDLRQVRLHGITRFPALTMRREGEENGVLIIGYRPYEALRTALYKVAPELEPVQHTTDEFEYRRYWGSITERELEEVLKGTVS
ncbi:MULTISPECIES: DsbA family protein [Pontibacter]|uniref:DsbA family oxidoreductase n=1 Tax=Pontibacter TaxID=323449 RepID=UPI0010CD2013|nr:MULTISPECIES: DsbA family protein [Pontibacter]QCR25343.1 disulfide bond formation protein DsbA [Pontibacter sp. SGAir0037]